MKVLPITEQENGKLKLLNEEETDIHVEGIMGRYRDLETEKHDTLDDLLFHYIL